MGRGWLDYRGRGSSRVIAPAQSVCPHTEKSRMQLVRWFYNEGQNEVDLKPSPIEPVGSFSFPVFLTNCIPSSALMPRYPTPISRYGANALSRS